MGKLEKWLCKIIRHSCKIKAFFQRLEVLTVASRKMAVS
jgi:hypothetical protein